MGELDPSPFSMDLFKGNLWENPMILWENPWENPIFMGKSWEICGKIPIFVRKSMASCRFSQKETIHFPLPVAVMLGISLTRRLADHGLTRRLHDALRHPRQHGFRGRVTAGRNGKMTIYDVYNSKTSLF